MVAQDCAGSTHFSPGTRLNRGLRRKVGVGTIQMAQNTYC